MHPAQEAAPLLRNRRKLDGLPQLVRARTAHRAKRQARRAFRGHVDLPVLHEHGDGRLARNSFVFDGVPGAASQVVLVKRALPMVETVLRRIAFAGQRHGLARIRGEARPHVAPVDQHAGLCADNLPPVGATQADLGRHRGLVGEHRRQQRIAFHRELVPLVLRKDVPLLIGPIGKRPAGRRGVGHHHAGFAGLVLARAGGAVPGGERAVVADIHRQVGVAPLAHGLGRVRVQIHLAVVIGHMDALAVEARAEQIPVIGVHLDELGERAVHQVLVIERAPAVTVAERDLHAGKGNLIVLGVLHNVRVVLDPKVPQALGYANGGCAVAAVPIQLRETRPIQADQVRWHHHLHPALGERIDVDEHRMVALEIRIVQVRAGERPAGQQLDPRAVRQDQAAVKVRPGEAPVAQLTYRRVRLKARQVQVGAVGERPVADRGDLLVLTQARIGQVLAPLVRVGGDGRQALHIPQTGGLKAAFQEAAFTQSADFSGLLDGKAGQRGAAGKRLRADRTDMHIREADEGELRAGGEGEIAYGIQTVVLEAHRRQTRRALAQTLGYVGNVIVDDEVRDVARGDGVALGVVLVDAFREIALFIASIYIPTGHELAEWVQDPLLRRLIAGGTLGRVVRYIGGFPGGLGARFAAFGRCGIGTFASTLVGGQSGIVG